MQIIVQNDAAGNANASFLADEQTAVNILDNVFTDNISVTIQVGFGEFEGTTLTNQNISEADINPNLAVPLSYSTLVSDLKTFGEPGFFNSSNLPANPGQSNFYVSSSVAAAFGIFENGTDGFVGIGTDFTPGAERVDAFLHEMCHALGRVPETLTPDGTNDYSELDLWRFTGYNARLYDGTNPDNTFSYFSLNDGATDIAQWGQTSDSADFRNGYPYTNDPFNETVGTKGQITNADIKIMEALGFSTIPNVINTDVTGSGTSDVILINSSGGIIDWILQNDTYAGYNSIGVASGYNVIGTGDFKGDGVSDVLLENSVGNIIDWTVEGGVYTGYTSVGNANTSGYGVVGTGDFNGNGTSDLLLENGSGSLIDWMISNGAYSSYNSIGNTSGYGVIGTGDFSGNGTSDVLLQSGNGSIIDWMLQNGRYASYNPIGNANASGYGVVGTGDFNGDGTTDILLENGSGNLIDWIMQNGQYAGYNEIGNTSGYGVVGIGDYTGTQTAGVLLANASGNVIEWTLNNGQFAGWFGIGNASSYSIVNK